MMNQEDQNSSNEESKVKLDEVLSSQSSTVRLYLLAAALLNSTAAYSLHHQAFEFLRKAIESPAVQENVQTNKEATESKQVSENNDFRKMFNESMACNDYIPLTDKKIAKCSYTHVVSTKHEFASTDRHMQSIKLSKWNNTATFQSSFEIDLSSNETTQIQKTSETNNIIEEQNPGKQGKIASYDNYLMKIESEPSSSFRREEDKTTLDIRSPKRSMCTQDNFHQSPLFTTIKYDAFNRDDLTEGALLHDFNGKTTLDVYQIPSKKSNFVLSPSKMIDKSTQKLENLSANLQVSKNYYAIKDAHTESMSEELGDKSMVIQRRNVWDRPSISELHKKHLCQFPSCGKHFLHHKSLVTHLRIHTGEKPFECQHPGCGVSFSRYSNFFSHKEKHLNRSERRQFSCSYSGCKKHFLKKANLEDHMNIHFGLLPHTCEFPGCGKSFRCRSNLCNHNRMHIRNQAVCMKPIILKNKADVINELLV